jgi:hypothetical protein
MKIPDNFALLHQAEERIRRESFAAIEQDEALLLHLDALERSMNLIHYFALSWQTKDTDDEALQILGTRLFNGAGASIKLLLSGYYQAAASLARELLETSFLVDLLANDRGAIRKWWQASDEDRRKSFQPRHIREALDKRDKLTSSARAKHYRLLSTVASHPTPVGFRMLRRGPNDPVNFGPFFNAETLHAVLSELGKIVVPAAGHFRRHFDPRSHVLTDFEVLFAYVEGAARWKERFLGAKINHRELEEARQALQMAQAIERRDSIASKAE